MLTILLVVLVVLALAGGWPGSPVVTSYGYGPSGLIGIAVIILLVLLLAGRL